MVMKGVSNMKILRIDMSNLDYSYEEVPDKWKMLGGRGLISSIINDEVHPLTKALEEGNKLIFAPGILVGTGAPTSGRLSVGAKSVLTGGIKEANSGGTAGNAIGKLGLRCIILEGKNDDLYSIYISKDEVKIEPCLELKEMKTYKTSEIMQEKYGKESAVISIGPAGERLYPIAGVAITDREGHAARFSARGGLGAIMGSKGVKAVVVDPAGGTNKNIVDSESFKKNRTEWVKTLAPLFAHLTKYGTANSVDKNNETEVLPTHGFSGKAHSEENIAKISAKKIVELQEERGGKNGHACQPGCFIRCSNVYNDENGEYLTSGFEYETIALVGANNDIFNIDLIAKIDRFCDEFGIDTIDFGGAVNMAIQGGIIEYGDEEGLWKMAEEMENDTLIGKILGQGTEVAGKVFGAKRITATYGQGFPGYDPRVYKGTAVTYSTSPMGADHTAGCTLPGRQGYHERVAKPMDPADKTDMVLLSRDLQVTEMLSDTLGLCAFMGAASINFGFAVPAVNYAYGTEYTLDELRKKGEELLKMEFDYNKRCGLSIEDMPEFFREEPTGKRKLVYDVPQDEIYNIWNMEI